MLGAACVLAAAAVLLAVAPPAGAAREAKLGAALAGKLVARKALRPETHTTDFATDALGCITLSRWELRRFGYAGHAFVCEEAASGEVLGAVLNKAGLVRCHVTGAYVGDGCYDLVICGNVEPACVD
jgi:hypothetical protein